MTKEEALTFVNQFVKSGEKYITIRIRDGYIGKELDKSGRHFQTERTAPRGTLVAIKGKDNKVSIGETYLNKTDENIPIIGVAQALANAIAVRDSDNTDGAEYVYFENDELKVSSTEPKTFSIKETFSKSKTSKNDKDLKEFFRIRSLCYFFPEIYSHSRGSEPIEYPNYDKIHENRKKVLGE